MSNEYKLKIRSSEKYPPLNIVAQSKVLDSIPKQLVLFQLELNSTGKYCICVTSGHSKKYTCRWKLSKLSKINLIKKFKVNCQHWNERLSRFKLPFPPKDSSQRLYL